MNHLSKNGTILLLQTRDELIKIDLKAVVYAESDGNYSRIYFINGVMTMILMPLSKLVALFERVAPGKFSKVGKRHIVAKQKFFSMNIPEQKLILTDLESPKVFTLDISKDALKEFRDQLVINNSTKQ